MMRRLVMMLSIHKLLLLLAFCVLSWMHLAFLAGLDLSQPVWLCGFYQSLFEGTRVSAKYRSTFRTLSFGCFNWKRTTVEFSTKAPSTQSKEKDPKMSLFENTSRFPTADL